MNKTAHTLQIKREGPSVHLASIYAHLWPKWKVVTELHTYTSKAPWK